MVNKNFLIKDIHDYELLFKKIEFNPGSRTIIYLKGDLGSGKTTFVQKYLTEKYKFIETSSPTFGIINTYSIRETKVYRYDLYRIIRPSELDDIGFYENLAIDTLHFIEWPEIIPKQVYRPDITITFQLLSNERLLSLNIVDE